MRRRRRKAPRACFIPARSKTAPKRQRRKSGIDIEDATWDKLKQLAGEYKLAAELDLRRIANSDRSA